MDVKEAVAWDTNRLTHEYKILHPYVLLRGWKYSVNFDNASISEKIMILLRSDLIIDQWPI